MIKMVSMLVFVSAAASAAEPVMIFSFSSEKIEFRGDDIRNADPRIDPQNGEPVIIFRVSNAKARELGETTSRHIGETMDIFVCGKLLLSPKITAPILGGYGQLSGAFDYESANELAQMLLAGDCAKQ
jgi:preprotein translocase subunit SecD